MTPVSSLNGRDEMTRVVATRSGLELRSVPVPQPAEGQVLVRMRLAGVCGSDLHAVTGHHPFVPLPYAPGHEVVGVVEGAGKGVDSDLLGARVTVEPTLPCGDCKMCRTDRSNLCERLVFFGCGYEQGGMADLFTVDATRLHRLPDELDDLQAALVEPLSTPVHAARIAGDLEGKAVAILGAGTIGLLMLAAVRHRGARRVVVTDLSPHKRERAQRLGADATVDPTDPDAAAQVRELLGESGDVVFDCVAVQSTMDQAVTIASKAGTVVVVGVAAAPVTVPLPIIQDHQIRIQGSATYLAEDYAEAMEIIAAGKVRDEDIVTAVYPLREVREAFTAAASGDHVKVLLSADS